MQPLCDLTGPLPDRENVLPALRAGEVLGADRWFIAEMVPGSQPFKELETAKKAGLIDRGGLRARILTEGTIRVGDVIRPRTA